MAILWFAIIACTVFWRIVFKGEVLYYGDIMLYFHPLLAFEHEWLSRGILPLWNPHTLFGHPFVGNPQESLFYPSTLLVAWLGAERAISWGAVIHLWLAGLGVYAFARRRGYSPRAAIAAGTLWCLCGVLVLRTQHVTILQTLAWCGWSLWAVEGLLRQANLLRATHLSVVLALASLAGASQMFHILLFLLLWWVAYHWREVTQKRKVICWGSAATTVALLIGGGHWLPLSELLRYTERDSVRLIDCTGYTLRPDHLILFLVPNLFGFPWHGEYMLKKFYWEHAFFVGTVPTVIVLARWRQAQGVERLWKRTTFFSMWLAVGPAGGLYLLAYYLIPGMQSFRTPLRWIAVTDLALCMWAASVLDRVVLGRRWWRLPMGMLGLAVFWSLIDEVLARILAPYVVPDRTLSPQQAVAEASRMAGVLGGALWRAAGMCALAVWLLSVQGRWRWWLAMGITVAELLWIAVPANPTCSPDVFRSEPQISRELRQQGQRLFVPDAVAIWKRYVSSHDYGPKDTSFLRKYRETLASNIGMAHGLSEASGYEPGAISKSQSYFTYLTESWRENPALLRRAGIGAIAFGDSAEEWRIIFTAVPGARAWMVQGETEVRWQMPTPQHVRLFPDKSGELVLADSAYPGWRVWIDGQPTRWKQYEECFRAVEVPEGARQVEWRYTPDTFRVGLFLTCLGLSIVIGMAVCALSTSRAAARC